MVTVKQRINVIREHLQLLETEIGNEREELIEELVGGYWENYDFINRQHLLAIIRNEERFDSKCWNKLPVGIIIGEHPELKKKLAVRGRIRKVKK